MLFQSLIVCGLFLCTVVAAEDLIKPKESPSVVISVSRGDYEVYNQELHIEISWRVDFVESIRGVTKGQMKSLKKALISSAFPYPEDYGKKGDLARRNVAHYKIIDYSRRIAFGPDKEERLAAEASLLQMFKNYPDKEKRLEEELSIFQLFQSWLRICFVSAEYVTWSHTLYDMDCAGSGCHRQECPRVYSIRKQRFVTEEEFIDMKKFPDVCNLILAEYRKDDQLVLDVKTMAKYTKVDEGALWAGVSEVKGHFTVELDGMRWWLPPYTIFCGAAGNVEVFLSWKQLRPYLLPGVEEKFRLSKQQKMDLCARQK